MPSTATSPLLICHKSYRHQQSAAGHLGSTSQYAFAALDLPSSISQVFCAAVLLMVANRCLAGLVHFIPAPAPSRGVGQTPSDKTVTADPDLPTSGIRSETPLLAQVGQKCRPISLHCVKLHDPPPPQINYCQGSRRGCAID